MKYALILTALTSSALAATIDLNECATASDNCNGRNNPDYSTGPAAAQSTGDIISGPINGNGGGSINIVSNGDGSSGSNIVNGKSCPGDVYDSYCCIGHVDGPALTSLAQSLSSQNGALSSSLGAAAASRSSALDAELASVTNADFDFVRRAQVTAAPLNKRAATRIADGVTCYGSAVSLSADGYSDMVASATSAREARGESFTATGGAVVTATGSSSSSSGSSDDGDDGDDSSSSSGGSASAQGQATSSNSDGAAAPRYTGAAMLVGGVAGAVVLGAM